MSFGAALVLALLSGAATRAAAAETARPAHPDGVDVDLANDMHSRQFPSRLLYLDVIRREAINRELPPAIADAVVRVESGYDAAAIGGVGEIGLMQVRPATAALLGFSGTHAELADPETNIRYGVAYLAEAWRLSGGDLCRTLMKYRAGHGAEVMSPLSSEYCRKARAHLAALGWSPAKRDLFPDVPRGPVARTVTLDRGRAAAAGGPKLISVASTTALLLANRARIAEAWNRLSVSRR